MAEAPAKRPPGRQRSPDGDAGGPGKAPATGAPESPTDLRKGGWWSVLKRTVKEFREDDLTDWAAALTYYTILALFPALIVLASILGLLGQNPQTTDALLKIVKDLGPSSA